MPILDGYETCDKIFKLFNQPRMFSHDECIIQIDKNPEEDLMAKNIEMNKRLQFNRSKKSKIVKTNKIKSMIPYLVAISSTPKTQKLEEELVALGFNMFIENPVQS